MKRETRSNLLFLGLFLAITLPGAVILFKKKLNPNAARLFLPDAIQHRIAYMAPIPDISETRRIVPPLTHRWIASLIEQHAPKAQSILPVGREGSFAPAVSEDKSIEVVAFEPGESSTKVYLLLWNDAAKPRLAITKWTAVSAQKSDLGAIEPAEWIALPKPVRDELRQFEFAGPPESVGWLAIKLPFAATDNRSVTLTIVPGLGNAGNTTVNFFTTRPGTN